MKTLLHLALDGDTSGYFPQLARWHDRAQFRMLFATLRTMDPPLAAEMERQGVACLTLGCRTRRHYPAGLARLTRILRRHRVDILHAHLFDPSVVGLPAGALARTPVRVLTRHYSDYHTRIGRGVHVALDRLCTRLAHAVIAVSRHTAEHLTRVEGAPPDKVHTVLNGIDFDRLRTSAPETVARLRAELGRGRSHLLLCVARLHPEKGHAYLFRALPGLRRRAEPVRVLLAGTGPFEGDYRRQVAELGCEDIVTFLGFRHDVADLIAAADLLVLPSLAEAFGLVLAEALYLGTPVLATRVGGIPEIVDDGRDGVLVPPADPRALEDALAALLADDGPLTRLRGAGTQKIAERFRFDSMVRRYEALYAQLSSGTDAR